MPVYTVDEFLASCNFKFEHCRLVLCDLDGVIIVFPRWLQWITRRLYWVLRKLGMGNVAEWCNRILTKLCRKRKWLLMRADIIFTARPIENSRWLVKQLRAEDKIFVFADRKISGREKLVYWTLMAKSLQERGYIVEVHEDCDAIVRKLRKIGVRVVKW